MFSVFYNHRRTRIMRRRCGAHGIWYALAAAIAFTLLATSTNSIELGMCIARRTAAIGELPFFSPPYYGIRTLHKTSKHCIFFFIIAAKRGYRFCRKTWLDWHRKLWFSIDTYVTVFENYPPSTTRQRTVNLERHAKENYMLSCTLYFAINRFSLTIIYGFVLDFFYIFVCDEMFVLLNTCKSIYLNVSRAIYVWKSELNTLCFLL